ncbi:MAG: LLM class flavin-dependent oxidoreductase [bacterium]|nr:LLM class flavin-dependent oxidoreductase [bacterium]
MISGAPQILDWATTHRIPVLAPGRDLGSRLCEIEHDYLFSITHLEMIPDEVLALPRKAAINFHDGPLPRYAGMYAPVWALIRGESDYGVTFHQMTSGADEGEIFAQRLFTIGDDETSLTLNTRCYEAAIEAFAELVAQIGVGTATGRAQNLDDRSYFARHRRPAAAAVLDWRCPAVELAQWVRAMDFGHYENAFASARLLHQGSLRLVRTARAEEISEGVEPGRILTLDDGGMLVACAPGGALRLVDFSCPKGIEQTAMAAAADLGVGVGALLDPMTDDLSTRLDFLGEQATKSERFWVRRLSTLSPAEMPYRNHEGSPDAAREVCGIDLVRPAGFTGDGHSLIAGFIAYHARLSGRDSLDFGFSDERLRSEVAGLEALFSAVVPLRVEIDLGGTAGEARESTRRGLERVRDRGSFFADTVARYPQLSAKPDLLSDGLASLAIDVRDDVSTGWLPSGADCGLVVNPSGERARLIYDVRFLDPECAQEMVDQIGVFLEGFGREASPLRKLRLQNDVARARMLFEWNDTRVDYPSDRCIHELFDAQAERTPDEVAVVFEGESLSYRVLAARTNQLAHHLTELGVGRDKLVGIHLDRSLDMVVSVMAVLKSGGAYVPLDPTYPADRIAFMIDDSKLGVVLTTGSRCRELPSCEARIIALDRESAAIADRSVEAPRSDASPTDLSYVIYTSGSTGQPKGVMVEHRNVVNFFAGMDERIPHSAAADSTDAWLALTSLSFDISVLELLWTITRGFKLVVHRDRQRSDTGVERALPWRGIDFGLALWGSDAGPGPRKYELMLEAAKFGDTHGFKSVMTPERHFGAFGGPFPNPVVTSAAIAAVTSEIQIRAGSCIAPLHHPIRIAEDWAVVDNLSAGRVGISYAAGWQPNDFIIRPEVYENAKSEMFENAALVRRLWQGEAVEFENPLGERAPITTLPRPVQEDLPAWMTTAGNVETFRQAGAEGYHLLTHLLGQSLEELSAKIRVYRQARKDAGLDPKTGIVTCMLHTYVGEDLDTVREVVRQPMKDYLASAVSLVMGFAWTFPAFERPGGPDSKPEDVDLSSLTAEETDAILEFAFERYFETSGLMGTPEVCAEMVDRVKGADVNEIVSLIDFGVPNDLVLKGLTLLDEVRSEANRQPAQTELADSIERSGSDYSLSAQVVEHGISHMQCTPSHASMLLTDPDTRDAVARIDHWMIGGEAFPVALAADLDAAGCRNITNMYGPTETTIWSSTEGVSGAPSSISIGRPIANTQFYILGEGDEPLPVGIPGELLIGGHGVVRGYLHREELTAERFIPDPFSDDEEARLYRTGDLASWKSDGTIEFLGRLDHQVKIRGYRIELGEIEARLSALPSVRDAVVIAREDSPGDVRLVGYLIAEGSPAGDSDLREALAEHLPDFMLPSVFVYLDHYPQTPNGKIDRKALPAPSETRSRSTAEYKPPASELELSLAEVWKEVLYLEQVGLDDNFFDLGGHSLLVVQAHRKLREVVSMPLSLTDLYRFPTIRGLVDHISSGGGGGEQAEKSLARGEKRRQALGRRRRRGGRE